MPDTLLAFNDTRRDIGKRLRRAVKEVNRLLAQALDSGVMVTVRVDGHPRYDVATYGGYTEGSAQAD